MKTKYLFTSLNATLLVAGLSWSANVRAVISPAVQPISGINSGQSWLEPVDEIQDFRNRPEAKMLAHAYAILATGDHDYDGHRVAAMNHVQRAGGFLGVDLAGDLKDHTKQVLSDDKMREAQRLIKELILKDNIKSQKHVFNQLTDASKEIDLALATK